MPPPPAARPLVFVMCQSPAIAELVAMPVRQAGAEATAFDSLEALLVATAIRQPALVLVDSELAPRSGDECCRALKSHPQCKTVPVVMMTAAGSTTEVMRSWTAGADDFLSKPVRREVLASKLEALRGATQPVARGPWRQRVLFVDDDAFFRTVLGGAMENSGIQLLYASDGAQALRLLEAGPEPIDAVISDLIMPGIDGLALARRVRAIPRLQSVPILLLTGGDPHPQTCLQAEKITGNPLIDKRTIPIEAIVTRVSSALRRISIELRVSERLPFYALVEFRAPGGADWLSGCCYDVSEGGVFVRTLTPLEPASAVQVRILDKGAVEASGVVAWSNPYRQRSIFTYPVGMGVRLTSAPGEPYRALLDRIRPWGR